MIGLKMCSGFICAAALATKHHAVGEFLNGRMKYKFMQTTRIGLHLRGYVVSSKENPNPFPFYGTLQGVGTVGAFSASCFRAR